MHQKRDTVIHLVAGGMAGTAGAILTCPLEVVKTRLQSSHSGFERMQVPSIASANAGSKGTCTTLPPRRRIATVATRHSTQILSLSNCTAPDRPSMGLIQCLRHIIEVEGPRALFRGLGPNLVGVAPSRAIYFCAYSQSKEFFNTLLTPNTAIVHLCAAGCAGFTASTMTNPIWFVKTRLQLDVRMSTGECIRRIYQRSGIRGFYKGITASYFGISETVVHFVIYEALKAQLIVYHSRSPNDSKSSRDFLEFMVAGAVSKTIASCIAYPHEVARTRLREEGSKYRTFWQTLSTVFHEEGHRGLYRGLTTQLVRQIPNTAIMMATYEAVVYILTSYYTENEFYVKTPNYRH